MKQKITENLRDPEALEKLYRENRREFIRDFEEIPDDDQTGLIRFWKIRLKFEPITARQFSIAGLAEVLIIALITALLVKLPQILSGIFPHLFQKHDLGLVVFSEQIFYTRDLVILIFNGLIVYTLRQRNVARHWIIAYAALVVGLLVYVNLLPVIMTDSITIALIHTPLLLWCLFGAAFISCDFSNVTRKMAFIRFNGELVTMTGLLLITGGILTAITIGLFSTIGFNIEEQYFNYIALPGATVSPIIASYLISLYPDITRRIVPVIARVFTPVVLVTLVVYLVSLSFSGIRILEDRELLILFNIMLVAVMAIIVFSISELDKSRSKSIHVMILLILAIITLVINSVALTAIVTRLTYGITPNRVVVFITNVLVFVNLILIAKDLYRSWYNAERLASVERTVAQYLTVYFIWTILAVFLLPAVFGYN